MQNSKVSYRSLSAIILYNLRNNRHVILNLVHIYLAFLYQVTRSETKWLWRCGYHQNDRPTRWGLAFKWIVKSFLPPLDSVHEHMYRMLCKQIAGAHPLFSRYRKLHLLLFLWDPFLFSLRLPFTPPRAFCRFNLSFRSIVSPSSLVQGKGIGPSRSVYPAAVFKCRSNAP